MDDVKVSASSQVLFRESSLWGFDGMHLCAYFGLNNNIMARLLEEKDPDRKDSSDRTPLYYATEKGNVRL
jgi:hypothetical protein